MEVTHNPATPPPIVIECAPSVLPQIIVNGARVLLYHCTVIVPAFTVESAVDDDNCIVHPLLVASPTTYNCDCFWFNTPECHRDNFPLGVSWKLSLPLVYIFMLPPVAPAHEKLRVLNHHRSSNSPATQRFVLIAQPAFIIAFHQRYASLLTTGVSPAIILVLPHPNEYQEVPCISTLPQP